MIREIFIFIVELSFSFALNFYKVYFLIIKVLFD